MGSLAHIVMEKRPLIVDMHDVFRPQVATEIRELTVLFAHFQVQPMLRDKTTMGQQ